MSHHANLEKTEGVRQIFYTWDFGAQLEKTVSGERRPRAPYLLIQGVTSDPVLLYGRALFEMTYMGVSVI